MKGIRKGESRAKESNPLEPGKRRCAKCGRLDFILMKKMGIKSGFTFWNLVFLLTVSCVKGGMGWGVPSALDGGELTRHQRWLGYFVICTDKIIVMILKKELIQSSFPTSDRKCILLARFGVQCSD
uniref:Uncharacterized protein n=1 Tax=Myotis lucifugus TaxID=59463 RepID=G1Q710_MYOLU